MKRKYTMDLTWDMYPRPGHGTEKSPVAEWNTIYIALYDMLHLQIPLPYPLYDMKKIRKCMAVLKKRMHPEDYQDFLDTPDPWGPVQPYIWAYEDLREQLKEILIQ